MKKLVRAIVCLTMALLLVLGSGTSALAEHCKYGSEGECEIIWWVDGDEKMHARACKNHVEDKEYGNYVLLTDWEKCTLDEGGECTTCGHDYIRDPDPDPDPLPGYELDPMSMEFLMVTWQMCMEELIPPVDFKLSGNKLSIEFTDAFYDKFYSAPEDFGFEADVHINETMAVPTTYTISLEGGTSYNYTGSAIKPRVKLTCTEYGPMGFLLEQSMMEIQNVEYKNNVNPGTATASVMFNVAGMDETGFYETLSVNFTIVGEGGGDDGDDGDDDDGGLDEDQKELIEEALKTENGAVIIQGALETTNVGEVKLTEEAVDVEDIQHKELKAEINSLETGEVVGVIDVKLENAEIKEGTRASIEFEVGDQYNGWKMKVLHGKKNGVEIFETTAKDGKVTVKVSELSPFAIIAIEAPAAAAGDLPQTGDTSSLMLWMALLGLSLTGAAACGMRRKSAKR